MRKKKKKRLLEINRKRAGGRRTSRRVSAREEAEYYDDYEEAEYDDGYGEEAGYYDDYEGEEPEYEDGYGEEAVMEEAGYYEGEEAACDDGYVEEAEYYDEYAEDGGSEGESEYYDEYVGDAVLEEEPEYDEYVEEAAYYGEYEEEIPAEEGKEYHDRQQRKRKPSRRKKRNWLLPGLCALFLAGLVIGILYRGMPGYFVKEELTIEAGSGCPSAAEFLKRGDGSKATVSGIDENTVFNHVEDIPVTVHVSFWDVPSVLHVTDTTAPELETKNVTVMLGETPEVGDFVENVSDVTDYEVSWQEEPKFTAGGTYTVVLTVTDEGGNRTQKEAVLEVLEDTTPPVIEGVAELTAGVGKTVSYKRGITVTDDCDENVALEIDNSQVDLDKPGDYEVVYSATDKAGNKTEISTILHVIEEAKVEEGGAEVVVTEEMVNAKADEILAEITNPSMSQYEVLRAIYDWCNKKIAYLDGVPKTNWVVGAYEGLIERRGDCYTFAMSSKCLLNRAGIKNMDIERVRIGNSMHFWNLVDIGEGWHHFDTCRRGDGATFFYLTDEELMAYSNAHISERFPNGTHYYDRSLYPEIP